MPESLDMTIKMGVKFHSISPDRSELDSHSHGVSFQKRYFRKFSTNRAKLMHIPHVERLLLLRFL